MKFERGDVSVDENHRTGDRQHNHLYLNPAPEHGQVLAALLPECANLLDEEEYDEDEVEGLAGVQEQRGARQRAEQIHWLEAVIVRKAAALHQLRNHRAHAKQIHLHVYETRLSSLAHG